MSSWSVFPSGVMRYSTAMGREFVMTRSTIPLRSRRRSAAVRLAETGTQRRTRRAAAFTLREALSGWFGTR
jgi:hypothetical protein